MPTQSASSRRQILIVDDHELVRLGLSALLASRVQGASSAPTILEASSLSQALVLYAAHEATIDLVLLDLHLPDAHGLSGVRDFLARFPLARVVALSGSNDPGLVRDAMATGALAYLSKSGQMADVMDYVAELVTGRRPSPGGVRPASDAAGSTAARTVQTQDGERVHLTQRQSELLDDLLLGLSNREIAAHLGLSEGTVKNHVSAMLLLFGVRSRAQLISRLR